MFPITRTAVAMTKIERKVVKLAAKDKINLEQASDIFKSLLEKTEAKAPFSKNIFKRAYVWVKTFADNLKSLRQGVKNAVKEVKEHWNEEIMGKLTKNDLKETKEGVLFGLKSVIDSIKKEIPNILKNTGK